MSNRAKELIEDENLQRDAEILELVGFAKQLYKENISLTRDNENLKRKKEKGFLKDLTEDYDADKMAQICLLSLVPLIILIMGVVLFNHTPTNEYYLHRCDLDVQGQDYGTRLNLKIDWGIDIPSTHCFQTVEEAIEALETLQNVK